MRNGFASLSLGALNHLLAQEEWARERLRPFSGKCARIEFEPREENGASSEAASRSTLFFAPRLSFSISDGGTLIPLDDIDDGSGAVSPTVVIRLPAASPLLWLRERGVLFSAARIEGAADFAEALAFVFRNLSWDAEAELASFVGDIAAHRIVGGVRRLNIAGKRALDNLNANLAEYLTEETRFLPRKNDLTAFTAEIERLQKESEALEERLRRLPAR